MFLKALPSSISSYIVIIAVVVLVLCKKAVRQQSNDWIQINERQYTLHDIHSDMCITDTCITAKSARCSDSF